MDFWCSYISQDLLSTAVIEVLYMFEIFNAHVRDGHCYYYPHFTDEKARTVIAPEHITGRRKSQGLNLG